MVKFHGDSAQIPIQLGKFVVKLSNSYRKICGEKDSGILVSVDLW